MQTALERLKNHPETEMGFMLMRGTTLPAYNMQSAVDAEHTLIVAHDVVFDAADNRCLQPMAEAAEAELGKEMFNVIADASDSNGEQAAHCEAAGMVCVTRFTANARPRNEWDSTTVGLSPCRSLGHKWAPKLQSASELPLRRIADCLPRFGILIHKNRDPAAAV